MAGSRTLKLSILADVADLRDKLGQGSKEVESFGGRVADFGKKAGLAFAAAGAAAAAYAGKLLVDGVKAAVEDQKAQVALAGSLERVTGATKAQIAQVESWISKQGILLGVTDDELRPAIDRLARATGSVTEAQKLAAVAMDISAATGKSLESVSGALAKAQEGNVASLAKLTGGFEKAELKGKTLSDLLPEITSRFAGAAQQGADTFAGKMERLQLVFGEAKETVGSFVLDAITPLVSTLVERVIPRVSELANTIGTNLKPIVEDLILFFKDNVLPIFQAWWEFISKIIIPGIIRTFTPIFEGVLSLWTKIADAVRDNEDKLRPLFDLFKVVASFIATTLAPAIGETLGGAFKIVGSIVSGLIGTIANLISFITNAINKVRDLISLISGSSLVQGISKVAGSLISGFRASGGSVSAGSAYVVGERGAELFVPNRDGTIIPNNALGGGVTNNISINVSGALDKEGVARQIVDLLNNSYYRGTIGAAALQV